MSDIYIHYASCSDYSSYANIDSSKGSFFISALYQHYSMNIDKYKNGLLSLHDGSIDINLITSRISSGLQTAEIHDRLMHNVYIIPNHEHSHKPNNGDDGNGICDFVMIM
mgnify:CR=1 FL=1